MKAESMTKLTKQQLDAIRDALQNDKRGLLQSEQRQLLAHAEAVQDELDGIMNVLAQYQYVNLAE